MIKIDIDFNVKDWSHTIEKFAENINPNLTDMKKVGDILVEDLKLRLTSSTNIYDEKFRPNTRQWATKKAKHGGDPRPLIDSGQTLNSIKLKTVSKESGVISSIGDANWWHNNRRYPHYGRSRTFWGVSESAKNKVIEYLSKKIKGK